MLIQVELKPRKGRRFQVQIAGPLPEGVLHDAKIYITAGYAKIYITAGSRMAKTETTPEGGTTAYFIPVYREATVCRMNLARSRKKSA
jgi:hypothetical protein